jgi:hypothetical protein
MPYVLSVTGFNNKTNEPCYYQNYSSTAYVSLGVVDTSTCSYEWLLQGAEGSSFEAPVIAANIVSVLPPNTMHGVGRKAAAIQYLTGTTASPTFTSQGYVK